MSLRTSLCVLHVAVLLASNHPLQRTDVADHTDNEAGEHAEPDVEQGRTRCGELDEAQHQASGHAVGHQQQQPSHDVEPLFPGLVTSQEDRYLVVGHLEVLDTGVAVHRVVSYHLHCTAYLLIGFWGFATYSKNVFQRFRT